MKKISRGTSLRAHQLGMASIVVTMILMMVISLIVFATAKLSRREQRQSLDRQLNTQAFYAAESGVNDAVKAIEDNFAINGTLIDSDYTSDCAQFMAPAAANLNSELGPNVKYSCLLVDPTPTTLEGDINESSRAFPIRDKNDGIIESISIAWQDIDGGTNFGCPSNLPPIGSWNCTPLLRFDVVPTATANRTALNNSLMTGFLVPSVSASAGATTISYSPSNGTAPPIKTSVTCNTDNSPKYCKAVISGLGGTQYYLRLKSIYGGAAITVSAQRGGNDIELKDAQVVIDSTGKAVDVLRRIQVRVPINAGVNLPDFAIESSNSICKQLEINGAGTASSVNNTECPLN